MLDLAVSSIKHEEQPKQSLVDEKTCINQDVLTVVKISIPITALVTCGIFTSQFGLALGMLLFSGVAIPLSILGIFVHRRWLTTFQAPQKPTEIQTQDHPVYETEFNLYADKNNCLRLFVSCHGPDFEPVDTLLITYADVPNGIPYEIVEYYRDDNGVQSLLLQVCQDEPLLAKVWHPKLHRELSAKNDIDFEISFQKASNEN